MEGRATSILLVISLIVIIQMAKPTATATATPSDSASSDVHIVYMERPKGVDPEAYDIQVLSSVLGSEEAAKEALLYSYKSAASGFSASLTPKQVEEIRKKDGVLHVAPNRQYQLHSGPANLRLNK